MIRQAEIVELAALRQAASEAEKKSREARDRLIEKLDDDEDVESGPYGLSLSASYTQKPTWTIIRRVLGGINEALVRSAIGRGRRTATLRITTNQEGVDDVETSEDD